LPGDGQTFASQAVCLAGLVATVAEDGDVAQAAGGAPRSVVVTALTAALVAAGAMAAAGVLRLHPAGSDAAGGSQAPPAQNAALQCDRGPCLPLTSQQVGGDTVDLLADASGASGRLRVAGSAASNIFETRITQSTGARLTADSLQCVAGATSVCLVRGNSQDGTSGEVLVGRSGVWSRAEIPYFSSAGYLALRDVDGDRVPEVVAVQQDCGDGAPGGECQRVFAEVFTLSGNEMGCTRSVGGKAALPGWPVVAPVPAQLRSCRV
jgi:hypothetical protein